MILDAAKRYKKLKEEKIEEHMVTKFQTMLEDCTEEKERTPFLIENGCILWEDMLFTSNSEFDTLRRVFLCSKCETIRKIGYDMFDRDSLLRTINSAEVCPCENDSLEDQIYEIAAEAVQDAI